jgi:hypothetical protein
MALSLISETEGFGSEYPEGYPVLLRVSLKSLLILV